MAWPGPPAAPPSRQFRDLARPARVFAIVNAAFVVVIAIITDFGNATVIGGDYSVLETEIYIQVIGRRSTAQGAARGHARAYS